MYAKIFDSILKGSLYGDWQTRVVFEDLLILSDKHGMVDMTVDAIHGQTGMPVDIIKRGIKKLMEPDPNSRSKDEEGRRIVLIDDERDWGWCIVNYKKYSEMRTSEERNSYMRSYMQERRGKERAKKLVEKHFGPESGDAEHLKEYQKRQAELAPKKVEVRDFNRPVDF